VYCSLFARLCRTLLGLVEGRRHPHFLF
jgi:hypothetical protein